MLQVSEYVSRLRGEASMLVLRYMTEHQLRWLIAWMAGTRDVARIAGGYPQQLAARSSCWSEDGLRVRLATGRVLEFSATGCVWDSAGEVLGLTTREACAAIAPGLDGLIDEAPLEKLVLPRAFGYELVHVSRLTGGGVLLVLD
jgi:hypothetical protein